MAGVPPNVVVVFRSRDRARCHELWAVLDAAGIDAGIHAQGRSFLLVVRESALERAVAELDDYRLEVAARPPERPLDPLTGGALGALGYCAVLVAVTGLASRHALGADWFDAGRVQAGAMADGEWWRSVTALTLHVDTRHLLGNLFFGSVLGFFAAQGLGGGVAWLAILAGGALGNAANAAVQDSQHSAVGASTAVFAALGVLIALALHHRRASSIGAVRRWSPLIAGVLLLAWTGMGGERTDVLAHVTGLLAGLAVGALAWFVPLEALEHRAVQAGAAALTALALLLAWAVALG